MRAYFIWEQEGRPVGRELEFWLRAEEQVRSSNSRAAEPVAVSVAEPVAAVAAPVRAKTKASGVVARKSAKKEPAGTTTPRTPRQAKKKKG